MKTTLITTALIAALSIALLAGCTSPTDVDSKPAAPASTAEPVEVPTVEEPAEASIDDIVVGEPLTPEQIAAVRTEGTTKMPYTLSDGTTVLIDRATPLPENVKADVGTSIKNVANADADDPTYSGVNAQIRRMQEQSGKRIVFVTQLSTYRTMWDEVRTTNWRIGTVQTFDPSVFDSQAEATAAAQVIVSGQQNPASWEIIVG